MSLSVTWKILRWRIGELRRAGKLERAAQLVERHVRRQAGDVTAWSLLGDILLELDRDVEVERVANAALTTHPGEPQVTYLLIRALLRQSRTGEAERLADEQARLHPDSPYPHLQRTAIAFHRRDAAAMAAHAEACLGTAPRDPWVRYELARRLLPVAGQRPRARRLLEEVCRERPRFGEAFLLLGLALERDDQRAARRAFDTARRLWLAKAFREREESARQALLEAEAQMQGRSA